jgi:circadian clock protein KaiC
MDPRDRTTNAPALRRLPTRVLGLDMVLGGGLLVGDTCLVTGLPGTGKTTLGNQVAFAHASQGGTVVFATLLTESHDRMLTHLRGLDFFDHALVAERIHYLSLLSPLQNGDFEGVLRLLIETIRGRKADLLIIDGAGAARMFASSDLDYARFIQGLEARAGILGCTTMLMVGEHEAEGAATHVDDVIHLFNDSVGARDARTLRVVKMRGSNHLNGRHQFAIGSGGITVFPRLEAAVADLAPAWQESPRRLGLGIPGMDAMLAGGFQVGSSTLVLGPPGAGKT